MVKYSDASADNTINVKNTLYEKYQINLAQHTDILTNKTAQNNAQRDTKEKKDVLAVAVAAEDEDDASLSETDTETENNEASEGETADENDEEESEEGGLDETTDESEDNAEDESNIDFEQEFTLYSLSADLETETENFLTLKSSILDSIEETQKLIDMINTNKISLSAEQKIFIKNQSNQLKTLGKELSRTTGELNLYLSDLNEMFDGNNTSINDISLKYLLILNNMISSNEMLENGLNTVRMINYLFNANSTLPPNNTGRIVYGFRRNNEPPMVKDYTINEDGSLTENDADSENSDSEGTEIITLDGVENLSNVDQMYTFPNANVDTYNLGRSNIDSFYNTALLDNEFMFGRAGGYGLNGYGFNNYGMNGYRANGFQNGYGYGNGYNYNGENFGQNTPIDQTDNNIFNNTNRQFGSLDGNKATPNNTTEYGVNNTQNIEQNQSRQDKFHFKKNIDTYRTSETPTLTSRFKNFKQNVSSFFSKFSKPNRHIENPVYRYDMNDDEVQE